MPERYMIEDKDTLILKMILMFLPVATKVILEIGGQLIELSTNDLNDPEQIKKILRESLEPGVMPELKFKVPE